MNISITSNLQDTFIQELRKSTGKIGNLYAHLFEMQDPEAFDIDMRYTFEKWKETMHLDDDDSQRGAWFFTWHKSLRQSDYFNNCFRKSKYSLLTKEEEKWRKDFKWSLVEKKVEKRNESGRFTEDYKNYLDLSERARREEVNESINGNLDMMLWNCVQIDNKECLYHSMDDFFFFHKKEFELLLKKEVA